MKNYELSDKAIIVGDRVLLPQVGVSGLIERSDVGGITGGRRYMHTDGELKELPVRFLKEDNINKPDSEWNPDLSREDVQGF